MADGFSYPYQLGIGLGSLLIALIGLLFLSKILRQYFDDITTAVTLITIVGATNYLEYAGITNSMSHNWLFTIYAILIFLTIKFYSSPTYFRALGIGVCIGLAALTRPTEIIACIIPILWGVSSIEKLEKRLLFFKKHIYHLLLAGLCVILIGSIQLLYWKYISGAFFVYSYEEQGFSWLRPHFADGFFSYKAGWLVYTPIMVLSLIGIFFLQRKIPKLFWCIAAYVAIHIYITFAWDIWWYGGSLGQRAMVQSYAVLAFPLAVLIEILRQSNIGRIALTTILLVCVYYNLWITHHAHKGGLLKVGYMTEAYFWKVLGKQDAPLEFEKLLDTNELFEGTRNEINTIPSTYKDSTIVLNRENQFSNKVSINRSDIPNASKWVRISADYSVPSKEWDVWKMTQLIGKFFNNEVLVKTNFIRLHRFLSDKQTKSIYFDIKIPASSFSTFEFYLWNADSDKVINVNNLKIESFN